MTTSPLALAAGYATLGQWRAAGHADAAAPRRPADGRAGHQPAASAQMRQMLHKVVHEGTASFARIPGYPGGRQDRLCRQARPDGGYKEDAVLATFASVFPSHDPKYVLVVTLDEAVDTTGPEPRRTAGWTAVPWPPRSPVAWPRCWAAPGGAGEAEASLQADSARAMTLLAEGARAIEPARQNGVTG